jgi:dTDP-4-amino-4,6-dideoxygalactose transaminase
MTTGEGGMVTTQTAAVADWVRSLRNHGQGGQYEYLGLGYNYRMTEMQAAIGIVQLERLPEMLERRRELAEYYLSNLRDDGVIVQPPQSARCKHSWHQYTIRVPRGRDELQRHLAEKGIASRVYYPTPLHKTALFEQLVYGTASCPVAEKAAREVLSIPVHPGVSFADAAHIAEAINTWTP